LNPAAVGATVFASSLILSALTLTILRRYRVFDLPTPRSLHGGPTPRGGGIAPALAGLGFCSLSPGAFGSLRSGLVLAAGGFALLGLAEDLRGFPPLARLLSQIVIASIAGHFLLSGLGPSPLVSRWVALPVSVAFLVSYLNAFNFMDGINGISATQVLVAGVAWVAAGALTGISGLTLAGLVGASAAAGFLPFNFPRARMFLGDVGSYFFGGWLGATVVWAVAVGAPPEALMAPVAVYLADTGFTLSRRVVTGEKWLQPHKTHIYQQLVALGWSHAKVTLLVGATMVACSLLGLASALDSVRGSFALRALADLGICALLAAYLGAPRLVRNAGSFRSGNRAADAGA
jgi:UDP-GlcNAc:undecaprenyl-phosphate GlcNAc-1-phosphate transferase